MVRRAGSRSRQEPRSTVAPLSLPLTRLLCFPAAHTYTIRISPIPKWT